MRKKHNNYEKSPGKSDSSPGNSGEKPWRFEANNRTWGSTLLIWVKKAHRCSER
jgi:hypothetical protein